MTNVSLARKDDLPLNTMLSPKPNRKRRTSPSGAAKNMRREKDRPQGGGGFREALPKGLLDRKMTTLTLASLAQAATNSGKRLILEIRDENPVQIVHMTKWAYSSSQSVHGIDIL